LKRKEMLLKLKDQRHELVERYGIKSLYLFGSLARDEAHPGSDVDLLVEFKQPVGLFQFIELKGKLEDILGCPVDLGTRRSLKPYIKEQVLREAIRVA